MNFSGSFSRFGDKRTMALSRVNKTIKPVMSLVEKYVWNGVLSNFDSKPVGLFDPVWWRKTKWIIENAVIMKGNRK